MKVNNHYELSFNKTSRLMKSIEKSVIDSLDAKSIDLYPYIPYLLQGFNEMGTSAKEVVDMLKRNGFQKDPHVRFIDLGCGKGAVSLAVTKEFGFRGLGIDAVGQFVEDARKGAHKEKISRLCSFEVGDIRERIESLHDFDVAILGAVGYILATLKRQ